MDNRAVPSQCVVYGTNRRSNSDVESESPLKRVHVGGSPGMPPSVAGQIR